MAHISDYFKETGAKASVYKDVHTNEHFIIYYTVRGAVSSTEHFPGKALGYVEDAGENWALGIKQ